jgi:hypothetical protein
MTKLALIAALMTLSTSALADESEGVRTLPMITIYGRAPKPSVVVEIRGPTAAREAGLAHEGLRDRLMAQSIPPALRPQQ